MFGIVNYFKKFIKVSNVTEIETPQDPQDGLDDCDSCKENPSVEFCVDCSFNYCSNCLEIHGRIPASSHHKLLIASIKVERNIKQYSNCYEHSELMTLLCENCKVVVCSNCLTTNHKNHNCMHLSDYFDSTKVTLEENLKMKDEILRDVFLNLLNSEDMIRDNELRASNLKMEIQQRGEDAKKIIDSIVAAFTQNIDDELKHHRQIAEKVLAKLKIMEKYLNDQIDVMRDQLHNLSFANVTAIGRNTLPQSEAIPNYTETFSKSFYFGEDLNNIEKIFGKLHKAPQVRLVKEDTLDSNTESITLCKVKLKKKKKVKPLKTPVKILTYETSHLPSKKICRQLNIAR